jgi:hypothetical protein
VQQQFRNSVKTVQHSTSPVLVVDRDIEFGHEVLGFLVGQHIMHEPQDLCKGHRVQVLMTQSDGNAFL